MSPTVAIAQEVVTTSTSEAMKYGLIGVLCVVFAYVIVYLYRENRDDRREAAENEKKHVAELTACKEQCRTEKELMRSEFERRHREILEGYTAQLSQQRQQYDRREEEIRHSAEVMIERLANANKESSEALVEMLQQFLNKVVK